MKPIAFIKGSAPEAAVPGTGTNTRTGTKDYVVVDDTGDFSYYPSESAMLEDLEYVDEATAVLDRDGNGAHLMLDNNRNLRLGPSLGPAELSWLRHAWMNRRRQDLQEHRLLRFWPSTREALLSDVFETLTLQRAGSTTQIPWVLTVDGEEKRPPTLRDVDCLLANVGRLEYATVRDPYGHEYRPVRRATHRLLARGAGPIYYVEIARHPGPLPL